MTPPLQLGDVEAFLPRFAAALAAAPIASALLRLAASGQGDARAIGAPLVKAAQGAGCALLVKDDARLAARLGADGVHISGAGANLSEALESLKPHRIVGAGGLRSRDEAMRAGELGADYVMFGEPRGDGSSPALDTVIERTAWWAEIFETPCVAYAPSLPDAAALARAGADFVALGEAIWAAPSPTAALAEARAALAGAAKREA
jgi:thiamine-phosphate pyrophosphorylase